MVEKSVPWMMFGVPVVAYTRAPAASTLTPLTDGRCNPLWRRWIMTRKSIGASCSGVSAPEVWQVTQSAGLS